MNATLNDLYDRAKLGSTGMSKSTKVYGPIESDKYYILDSNYNPLRTIPYNLKDTSVSDSEGGAADVNVDNLVGILTPPDPKYQFALTEEGKAAYKQLEDLTNEQLIKQFYEVYYSPTGLNDVSNRLGDVNSDITNMHEIFPSGIPAVMSKSSDAAWKVGTNFAFQVDEGLRGAPNFVYTSYGFPPFISKSGINTDQLRGKSGKTDYSDSSFDLTNLLYRGNDGTLRKPAFKSINDNINLIQYLMNRCFGIESTYINEWDLSMYIQEGLVSYQYKELLDGSIEKIPNFATTLTYGLLTDAPIESNLSSPGDYADVNLDLVTPWAGVNMAVSERRGIDTISLGTGANEMNYEIKNFPLSAWWVPPYGGDNLPKTLNISAYIADMFSYEYTGTAYSESGPSLAESKGLALYYTPKDLHGGDLANSDVPLDYILTFSDYRGALLSGWNATDKIGAASATGTFNGKKNGNAFAYLPYYKLFYTNAGNEYDGIDQYMQDLLGDQEPFHSFIDVGDEIVQMITSDNEQFQNYLDNKQAATGSTSAINANTNIDKGGGGGEESDFKILGVRLKGSGLLKMFLKRNKKAKQASDSTKQMAPLSGANKAVQDTDKKKMSGAAVSGTPGTNQRTAQPEQLGDNDLGDMLTYGPGIAFNSPFLYGGPHGEWYSPLTLEGLVQLENPSVINFPKIDCNEIYEEISRKSDGSVIKSGNYKDTGIYLDKKVIIGTTERNSLIQGRYYNGNSCVSVPYTGTYETSRILKEKPANSSYSYNNYSYNGYSYYNNSYNSGPQGTQIDVNNGHSRWVWEPTIWKNTKMNNVTGEYVTKPIGDVCANFTSDKLHLIPVQRNFRMNQAADPLYAVNTQVNFDCRTFQNKGMNRNGHCVVSGQSKFIVMDGTRGYQNVRGSFINVGDVKNSSFYNYKKNLFDLFKRDANNSRTFPVTLPIVDDKGEPICLICCNAKIEKDKIPFIDREYRRRLKWWWQWYRRWHTHRFWWWRWTHEWFPWFRISYYWEWYIYEFINYYDMYTMYIYPDQVNYVLPSSKTVAIPNLKYRDINGRTTVDRWSINPEREYGYDHLDYLWPFQSVFINKWGASGTFRRPGTGGRTYNHAKVLKASDIIIGDVMLDYLKDDYQIYDKKLTGYVWDRRNKNILYYEKKVDSKYSGCWGYEVDKTTSAWISTNVTLTSNAKIAQFTRVKNDRLTKFMLDLAKAPSMVQLKKQNGQQKYYAYNVTDIYDTYIDTCTVQLAWLNQLKWFVNKCLKDSSIYYDYQHVTDPKILKVMACARDDTEFNCNEEVYHTHTYMEDMNYYDSLLILEKLFANSTGSTNTLLDLVNDRIVVIKALRKYATNLRNTLGTANAWTVMDKMSKLMTETRLILSGAKVSGASVRDKVVRSNGEVYLSSGARVTSIRPRGKVEPSIVSYDVLYNPAAVIWAYLNMLYQARKFYVSLRMNKVQGSYWVLRSLEKVLTFNKEKMNTQNKDSLSIPINPTFGGNDLKVKFVAPRESYEELSKSLSTILTYTQALYVPVTYVEHSAPMINTTDARNNGLERPKWGKYNNKDVVLIKETNQWAYKPADGYYYIMSDLIIQEIKTTLQNYKVKVNNIESKKMAWDDVKEYLSSWKIKESDFDKIEIDGLEVEKVKKALTGTYLSQHSFYYDMYQNQEVSPDSIEVDDIKAQLMDKLVRNAYISYWNEYYLNQINSNLYRVYIIWDPEGIKVARVMTNATTPYIDEFQKKETKEQIRKTAYTNVTVEDDEWPVGVNSNSGRIKWGAPIEAAITFGVANGVNLDTIINNRAGLKSLQAQEAVCGVNMTSDYWRIEVPEGTNGYDIITDRLSKNPRLISKATWDEFQGLLKGNVSANNITSLIGVMAYRASPVKEFDEKVLTSTTLSALGENVSVASLGTGKTESESERTFN